MAKSYEQIHEEIAAHIYDNNRGEVKASNVRDDLHDIVYKVEETEFKEAPEDGKQYARKDKAWAEITHPSITVDDAMSDTSTNPVQNKVIKTYIDTHTNDVDIHVTATQKSVWSGKQDALTAAQLTATNSGIDSTKVGSYDAHIVDTDTHVTSIQKTEWSGKQDALTSVQLDAANSGITAAKVSGYDTHITDADIHVTASDKAAWNAKYDKPSTGIPLSDLAASIQTSLGKADTALQTHQDISGKADVSVLNAHTSNSDIHVTADQKTEWSGKQAVLTSAQLNATNSGITAAKVSDYDGYATAKQDTLSTSQLNAVNSGINSTKVSTYDTHVADTDKHIASGEKDIWNAKYDKPTDGIPSSDMTTVVQTSLGKADTSIQDVKVNGTTVVSSGVANIPAASAATLGAVKIGANIEATSAGVISVPDAAEGIKGAIEDASASDNKYYSRRNGTWTEIPTATASAKGVVQVGENINVSSGKISVPKANYTTDYGLTTGVITPSEIDTTMGSWTPDSIAVVDGKIYVANAGAQDGTDAPGVILDAPEVDPTTPATTSYLRTRNEDNTVSWTKYTAPTVPVKDAKIAGTSASLLDGTTIVIPVASSSNYGVIQRVKALSALPSTLAVNVIYNLGDVTSITEFSLPSVSLTIEEFIIEFTATAAFTFPALPSGCKWQNGTAPTITAGHMYTIKIRNYRASYSEFY